MSKLVLPLTEVDKNDIQSVGGKAASLGEMTKAGLPVPKGFVVTLSSFDAQGNLNEDTRSEINALLDSTKLYAVRSSGLAEDAEGASWAGQFETFLDTKPVDVISKIEECHNSAKARAKAYASDKSSGDSFNIAVVVQEMVKPEYAGVLFTKDPVTGADLLVTEYVKGLGEKLVSGKVDPERVEWTYSNRATGPFDLDKLTSLAQKTEFVFGVSQDIEWAFANGVPWLVQSRHITTLKNEKNRIGLQEGLVELDNLLRSWGLSERDWVLTGQYVYSLLGFTVSVRPGHHNILIDKNKLPWEVQKDALEIYPVTDSSYAKEYQDFINHTGYEFDLIPKESNEIKNERLAGQSYTLKNGRKIHIQSILGQLEVLVDILSKSDDKGWGEEKGRRILSLVEELEKEFMRNNNIDLANSHKKVVEKYSYLKLDTKPISKRKNTDLQNETGFNLGKPSDLFYWGPSRAKPMYMSDFMVAVERFFMDMTKDPNLPNPPKTIALFYSNKNVWLINSDAFGEWTEQTFEAYEKLNRLDSDITEWKAASGRLDKLSGSELISSLVDAWYYTEFAEFSLYGAETALIKRLSRFDTKTRQDIWGAFTVPDKPTFLSRIDIELLAFQDPVSIAKKYPWIGDGYDGLSANATEYFIKRLKIIGKDTQKPQNFGDKRRELIKNLKLTDKEVSALTLARKLAEFMDNRKAWMMQTRRLVTQPVGDIKYGWFFSDGKVTKINKEDTRELWERYVDFKASTSAVVGIVASNGGKHFLNGMVAVVTSPTDVVEDGKIVVVPSTSPSYVPLMRKAKALITDHGGMMSHAAIVAREFNLPCIVGTKQATKVLKDGDKVVLDLVKGEVNR